MRLELEVDEIDYDKLVDKYLPLLAEKLRQSDHPAASFLTGGIPLSAARGVLRAMPREKKESLVAELVNGHAAELAGAAEKYGAEQGLSFHIRSIRATP